MTLLGFSNLSFIEEQYDQYCRDPGSLDSSWRQFFDTLQTSQAAPSSAMQAYDMQITLQPPVEKEVSVLYRTKASPETADIRVYNLIQGYREFGHLKAKINPITTHPIGEPWQLKLETYGFTSKDLSKPFATFGLLAEKEAPLLTIVNTLQTIYCDNIGVEYMEVENPQLEQWLQQKIEPTLFKANLTIDQKQMILQQLNKSELLESFLHTKYVGQKRFSLEGAETLIPMLSAILEAGSQLGMEEYVVGMAHRGRLNVLANILNKSYTEIFSEFDESYIPDSYEGSGDVKYHKGFFAEVSTQNGKKVRIDLSPNPSHLESVDPVVEGMTRAKQVQTGDEIKQEKVVPILIHGDASLAGQGVVYETMQLYKLEGYSTGGTIHIIINNQIGFTTSPKDTRSTLYCSDIAKAFGAPVFHVNAEDPDGCVYATHLAVELRQKFHCDVFIDLNCYRKYGHNEADEPAFTQPIEYQLIRKKKPIRDLYRDNLIQRGVVEKYLAESVEAEFKKALNQALKSVKIPEKKEGIEFLSEETDDRSQFQEIDTRVPLDLLQTAASRLCFVPEGFNIHPKLVNLNKERLEMVKGGGDSKPLDWGMAELLAYASLLLEGIHVRISGQDSCRGTFSHRHAMWMDQVQEKAYYPLKHLSPQQGRFDIYNSSLSENAVLGFEYGYSESYSSALVIWEAQFGDFSNGGQVVIDQFIAPAEQKWGLKSGLVLYLPHGYEGQGPEHSSGRIERFLQLAGHNNIRIANPTTPAQIFHLLRKQTKNPSKKPLIIFTPKGLLRHPDCVSTIEELSTGQFQEIIDDPSRPKNVKRLIFCSGRIYYDILAEKRKLQAKDLAVVRVEQLYPLHTEKLKEIFNRYGEHQEIIWAQEEPVNMGAWEFMQSEFRKIIPKQKEIRFVGRARSASTAVGSYLLHKRELAAIMKELFKQYELRMPHPETGIKS